MFFWRTWRKQSQKVVRSLLSASLDRCRTEYDESTKTFANLDAKAQNTVTVAGIFIAGLFAFLKQGDIHSNVVLKQWPAVILLSICATTLLVSVVACLYSMRIRKFKRGVNSAALLKMAADSDKPASPGFADNLDADILRTQIMIWQPILDDIAVKCHKKGAAVLTGQYLLAIAIFMVGLLVLLIMAKALNN